MGSCIIIPAYNAAATVPAVVAECAESGLPVLVVDDGSTDGTSASVRGLPAHLLAHPQNRGKGAALRTGFRWCLENGFEGAITIDSDGQHDPTAIPLVLQKAADERYDVLLASRSAQFEKMAGLRRHWNRFGAWCMKKRTGFDISDSQSGFRFYSSRFLAAAELRADGYHMEMEALLKAWKLGFRVGSVPVAARVADGRNTSHFRAVPDTWNICMTFLRYM
ncbi:MAG TPA: glycosyltransferase family 2 protein [Verrucomicrobiae bacterium]|nr:glycosyltransferase family 2 protein [Verrucomicrobiae bacterium]